MSEKEKLAALFVCRQPGTLNHYIGAKLLTSGRLEPVNDSDLDFAIDWMRRRGYKPWGFWLNGGPAIGWAVCTQDVITAWAIGQAEELPTAPATMYSRDHWESRRRGDRNDCRRGSVIFVSDWVIMTTRTGPEIARLARRYPAARFGEVDFAYVPQHIAEALHSHHRTREIRAGGRGAWAWGKTPP